MERRTKEQSSTSEEQPRDREERVSTEQQKPSIVDLVRSLAARNARLPLDNEEAILLYLMSWWSKTYNRPLKDPLLQEYSLEELLYEFFDRIEREQAIKELIESRDKQEEEQKEKEVLDWIEQEEKKELEREAQQSTSDQSEKNNQQEDKQNTLSPEDPRLNPDNIRWMEEQLAAAKQLYGDSFGEDFEFSNEDDEF
jgi:hypothetical protein